VGLLLQSLGLGEITAIVLLLVVYCSGWECIAVGAPIIRKMRVLSFGIMLQMRAQTTRYLTSCLRIVSHYTRHVKYILTYLLTSIDEIEHKNKISDLEVKFDVKINFNLHMHTKRMRYILRSQPSCVVTG